MGQAASSKFSRSAQTYPIFETRLLPIALALKSSPQGQGIHPVEVPTLESLT